MLRQGVLAKLPEQYAAILHATLRHPQMSGHDLSEAAPQSPKMPILELVSLYFFPFNIFPFFTSPSPKCHPELRGRALV
jgi:hypothetical protein